MRDSEAKILTDRTFLVHLFIWHSVFILYCLSLAFCVYTLFYTNNSMSLCFSVYTFILSHPPSFYWVFCVHTLLSISRFLWLYLILYLYYYVYFFYCLYFYIVSYPISLSGILRSCFILYQYFYIYRFLCLYFILYLYVHVSFFWCLYLSHALYLCLFTVFLCIHTFV